MQETLDRFARVTTAMLILAMTVSGAAAQSVDAQRDCQTLLKCQYAKGGSFRGCISSYSCKTCRMVPAKCTVRGEATCRRVQCGWGA